MTATPPPQATSPTDADPDTHPILHGSLLALRRAALRARLVAAQTGTAVVTERDGVLSRFYPQLDASGKIR